MENQRAEFGEFDAIIITQNKTYLIESKWDGCGQLKNSETYHAHTHPIEEIYLVTQGWIKLKAEGEDIHLTENQLLQFHPTHVT